MPEYTIDQLIDIDQVRQLLECHHLVSGMACGLFDNHENCIISIGWQDICTRFHRVHPVCSGRCRESDAYIKAHLSEYTNDYLEYRCGNGMIDVALPIIVEGRHVASLLTGQFFYDDDPPDRSFFLAQAQKFGFDPDVYLAFLERVPIFSRTHIHNILMFQHSMVRMLAESGLKSLKLTNEMEQRRLFEERYAVAGFALDQVREAAYLIDDNGRIQYVNQEACRSLGYSSDELLGMSVPDIDPDYDIEKVLQVTDRLYEVGAMTFETRHRGGDGRIFPVEIAATLFEYNGVDYNLSLVRDITERRKLEEHLLARERLLSTLLDNFPDFIARFDTEGRHLFVNQAVVKGLGIPFEEFIGKSLISLAFVEGENNQRLHEAILQAVERGEGNALEIMWRTHEGWRYFDVRHIPEKDEQGTVVSVLGIARDISEKKHIEIELKESEARYRQSSNLLKSILDSTPTVGVYALDREFRYLAFNQRHRQGMNYLWGGDIAFGMSLLDAVDSDEYRGKIRKIFDEVLTGRSVFAEAHFKIEKDGRQQSDYIENYGSPIFNDDGQVTGVTFFTVNVTERKRIEEQLRFSEQQYRTLAENSPGMIVRYDRDCRRVYVNPAFTRETGINPDVALGASLEDAWMNDTNVTAGEYTEVLRRVMATDIPAEILLEWPSRKSGRPSCHHFHIVAEKNGNGEICGCLAIDHDITRLRETELKLARLAEMSPGVLVNFLMGADGSFRMPYASHRVAELFGLSPESLAQDMTEAFGRIHPDDQQRHMESIMDSSDSLSPWHLEFRITHPGRGEIWVEGHSIPERQPDGGVLWYGFLHDITGRKRSEEALSAKRAQLAALTTELSLVEERERQNVATVLHDHIGQTLLLGRIKLDALSEEQLPEPIMDVLQETIELLDRVAHDIHSLTVQINPPVLATAGLEAALQWLGRKLAEDYGLCVAFEDDLWEKPLLDEIRSVLYQCGRELLINVAKHAHTGHARMEVARQDDFYRLTVIDNGIGFDFAKLVPDTSRDCRFGLLSIQIRMERMGGSVVFESAPSQGSRMTLLAPLALNQSSRTGR